MFVRRPHFGRVFPFPLESDCSQQFPAFFMLKHVEEIHFNNDVMAPSLKDFLKIEHS